VQLAELLEVIDGQVVAGQVQQRVDQHRAVAVGQHEAVTVGERWVARVVLEVVAPKHFGDIRHAHGGTGMAAVGFCTASMLRARMALARSRRLGIADLLGLE
jgi:hypothetical protein